MLTLYEELFLLAVHEEKGTVITNASGRLQYGLSGAILAELAFLEKIRVGEGRKLELVDARKTRDDLLNRALERIEQEGHGRKLPYWVKTLHDRPKKMQSLISERLVQKGVLIEEDSAHTWLIPAPIAPEVKASAKFALKQKLRDVALACLEPDLKEVALLALVRSSGLLDLVFIKDERKLAGQRIYELMISRALNHPLALEVEEICGAVETVVGAA
jgi:hypothetical protein